MSKLFEKVIQPALFRLDAERAHELGMKALELGLAWPVRVSDEEKARIKDVFGPIKRFGFEFENPLGIAAGFDKNAIVIDRLMALGFGFVEVGTVTYDAQPGNPRPRLFRLPDDRALINRLGFNNEGATVIGARLELRKRDGVVGVNIGRNKNVDNDDAIGNYLQTFNTVHDAADYIAVNVSSPNTPNLRDLQSPENLELLIAELQKRNRQLGSKPLLVKIAPDLTVGEIDAIVDLCLQLDVSGVIATNTTTSRTGLKTRNVEKFGVGGLSGRPLAARSNQIIAQIYRHSKGEFPIIGVGGVFTAQDAFDKIAAGASLIQAYTGFIYSGPSFVGRVVSGLADILEQRGFRSIDEAVGSSAPGG